MAAGALGMCVAGEWDKRSLCHKSQLSGGPAAHAGLARAGLQPPSSRPRVSNGDGNPKKNNVGGRGGFCWIRNG